MSVFELMHRIIKYLKRYKGGSFLNLVIKYSRYHSSISYLNEIIINWGVDIGSYAIYFLSKGAQLNRSNLH